MVSVKPLLNSLRSKMSSSHGTNGSGKKILVVFGATGNQGGSVVKSVLGDPKSAAVFSVRAITRDPSKDSAQALKKLGAECVAGDIEDKESLKAALAGAYAVYAVTDFWQKLDAKLETQQGKNIADIAKQAGVQHFVWSSLPNVTEMSGGKLTKVIHWDSKNDVEKYIKSIGLPATFFNPGFYMTNLPGQAINNKQGAYNFALPIPTNTPIPLLDPASDTGKFVKAILMNREKTLGQDILGATDYYTPEQIIADFQAVFPKDGQGGGAIQVPEEMFKKILAAQGLPEFVQDDLLENMLLMPQFGYYGGASLKESIALCDEPLTTFKEFAANAPAWKDLH